MDSIRSPFLAPVPSSLKAQTPQTRQNPQASLAVRSHSLSATETLTLETTKNPSRRTFVRRTTPAASSTPSAQYLRRLRRNQGPHAEAPRWVRRTPEQMVQYLEDDRDGHVYGKHVVAAVKTVRGLAGKRDGECDMREVMASFVGKLSFREMCVVLKEQRGWRQLCYRPSVIVYTIILRIYGQVGKIRLAEQIFLEMLEAGCEPDEVACGTMLCAYSRWGRHKDMMLFYSAVRRREILPSIAVYNFMISSLQKKKLHGEVIKLWKEMLDAGLKPDNFTYAVAIGSFVKEDMLENALDAFVEMKKSGFIPEEDTYSLLISLYAKNGREDEALRLYGEMKSQGIIPSNYTCSSLLTLHYKNSDYSKALSLFSEMEKNRTVPDEVIYGILIRIYGKLGLYDDAEQTFANVEKLGLLTNERTYVAMAQVHLNAGNIEKALDVLQLMRSRNVEISKFAYGFLLRCFVAQKDVGSAEVTLNALSRCGALDAVCCNDLLNLYLRLGLLEKAKALVTQIRTDQVQFDEELYRTVLEVFCRERMIADADKLIEEMENIGMSKDKINMTSVMSMYGECGRLRQAENLFKALEKPDAAACANMVSLFLDYGDMYRTKELLKSLLEMSRGLSVASQLIIKSVREGDVAKAESLYHQSIELGFRPEDAAIGSIISFYGRNQQLRKALEIYESASNFCPAGKPVYISMIDAYCKCGKIDDATHLYKAMVGQGHVPDAVIISVLVNALSKNGKYQEAECMIDDSFHGNMELDTVAYNTFIKSMLDAGKLHSAVSIYDRMITSGVHPSLQTYNTMISVYGQGGKLEKAIEMFSTAQSLGLSLDEKAYTNMIRHYGKAGRSQEASLLFTRMKEEGIEPGKISYNTMINVYATAGLHHEAENLFRSMQKDGHSPDSLTYVALIKAYTETHNYSAAEDIIRQMQMRDLSPSCAHFNQLIFAFIRQGTIREAERIYNQVKLSGLSPDLTCCRTMMRGYLDYGLVNEGILFFESINGFIKPDGFLLSAAIHLYEFVGKETEAGNVLDTMNIEGLLFLRNLRIGSKCRTPQSP
ncbi:pentatricopeptide repeat-containing protein At5g27270 isoform X2 [Asparagus officinalis]|uniref:pentatricopeptide repeat-containing protein At5g27270 isoform X2 n=1 Tax=Asparagus officinalis TaxID=4686 RepID=UPI00098E206A|nr:pentatricopeptide repeat-containing protein At5g27270 isoform X2 [Asparagus officinalis]